MEKYRVPATVKRSYENDRDFYNSSKHKQNSGDRSSRTARNDTTEKGSSGRDTKNMLSPRRPTSRESVNRRVDVSPSSSSVVSYRSTSRDKKPQPEHYLHTSRRDGFTGSSSKNGKKTEITRPFDNQSRGGTSRTKITSVLPSQPVPPLSLSTSNVHRHQAHSATDRRPSSPSALSSRSSVGPGIQGDRVSTGDVKRVLDRLKEELDRERTKNTQLVRQRAQEMAALRSGLEAEKQDAVQHVETSCAMREREMLQQQSLSMQELVRNKQAALDELESQFTAEKTKMQEQLEKLKRREKASQGTAQLLLHLHDEIKTLRSSYREMEEKYLSLKNDLINEEEERQQELERQRQNRVLTTETSAGEDTPMPVPAEAGVVTDPTQTSDMATFTEEDLEVQRLSQERREMMRGTLRSLVELRSDLDAKLSRAETLLGSSGGPDVIRVAEILDTLKELGKKVELVKATLGNSQSSTPQTPRRSTDSLLRAGSKDSLSGGGSASEGSDAEDKVLLLKRRNAELIALARRQEEKIRQYQDQQAVLKLSSPSSSLNPKIQSSSQKTDTNNNTDLDLVRRDYERRRAQDLAEHARAMVARDRQLENLRRQVEGIQQRNQVPTHPLITPTGPANASGQFVERDALQQMIRTSQMERLKLEKQLSWQRSTPSSTPNDAAARERIHCLTEQLQQAQLSYDSLQLDQAALDKKARQLDYLENILQSKDQDNFRLGEELKTERDRNRKYKEEINRLTEQTSRLLAHNSDLQSRSVQVQRLNEENSHLRREFNNIKSESQVLHTDHQNLQYKSQSMEQLLKHLQEAAEKRRELEREHSEVKALLEVKLKHVDPNNKDNSQDDALDNLKAKLRELDKRCALQALKHEEVLLELEAVKKKQKYEEIASRNLAAMAAVEGTGNSGGLLNGFASGTGRELPSRSHGSLSQNDELLVDQSLLSPSPKQPASASLVKAVGYDASTSNQTTTTALRNRAGGAGENLRVYSAKYNYDPYHYSPNDNPDLELTLNAGDYVIVHGDMDEDGFFYGELIDGRRGLVPSNFVEPVNVSELGGDFNLSSILGRPDGASTTSEDEKIHYESENSVPSPKRICLERQLTHSVLISWRSPDHCKEITFYHVYVDAQFRTAVKNGEKTRALVDGVDANETHRISIRSVTPRGQSKDAECCLVVGRRASAAPSRLKVTQLSSTAGKLSWLPGNSNYYHAILLNDRLIRTCSPGVYKTAITGLHPDSLHRVHVIARRSVIPAHQTKNIMAEQHGPLAISTEFRTLPGGAIHTEVDKNLPDSPLDVQIEPGPQDSSLLVTWLPVSVEANGCSNGNHVRGYMVCINGQSVLEVPGVASDHTVLHLDHLCNQLPSTPPPVQPGAPSSHHSPPPSPQPYHHSHHSHRGGHVPTAALLTVRTFATPPTSSLSTSSSLSMATTSGINTARLGGLSGSHYATASSNTSSGFSSGSSSGLTGEGGVSASLQSGPLVESEHSTPPVVLSASLLSQLVGPAGLRLLHMGTPGDAMGDLTAYDRRTRDMQSAAIEVGKSPTEDADMMDSPTMRHMAVPEIHITQENKCYSDEDAMGYRRRGGSPLGNHYNQYGQPSHHGHRRHNYHGGSRQRHQDYHRPHSDSPRTLREKGRNRGGRGHYSGYRDDYDPGSGDSLADELDWATRNSDYPPPPGHHPYSHRAGSEGGRPLHGRGASTSLVSAPNHQASSRQPGGPSAVQQGDKSSRVFVALFDYDPSSMSPNPDAIQEELPFREGQLIKIFGDKDEDGFFYGECNGRRGLVPYNMISEVHMENQGAVPGAAPIAPDPHANPADRHTQQKTSGGSSHSNRTSSLDSTDRYPGSRSGGPRSQRNSRGPPPPVPGSGDTHHNTTGGHGPRRMVALYDYDPQNLSPNVDVDAELNFRSGETVWIFGEMDEDGFFMGELPNGRRGLVPSNFLQDASEPPPHHSNSRGPPPSRGGHHPPPHNSTRPSSLSGGGANGPNNSQSSGHGANSHSGNHGNPPPSRSQGSHGGPHQYRGPPPPPPSQGHGPSDRYSQNPQQPNNDPQYQGPPHQNRGGPPPGSNQHGGPHSGPGGSSHGPQGGKPGPQSGPNAPQGGPQQSNRPPNAAHQNRGPPPSGYNSGPNQPPPGSNYPPHGPAQNHQQQQQPHQANNSNPASHYPSSSHPPSQGGNHTQPGSYSSAPPNHQGGPPSGPQHSQQPYSSNPQGGQQPPPNSSSNYTPVANANPNANTSAGGRPQFANPPPNLQQPPSSSQPASSQHQPPSQPQSQPQVPGSQAGSRPILTISSTPSPSSEEKSYLRYKSDERRPPNTRNQNNNLNNLTTYDSASSMSKLSNSNVKVRISSDDSPGRLFPALSDRGLYSNDEDEEMDMKPIARCLSSDDGSVFTRDVDLSDVEEVFVPDYVRPNDSVVRLRNDSDQDEMPMVLELLPPKEKKRHRLSIGSPGSSFRRSKKRSSTSEASSLSPRSQLLSVELPSSPRDSGPTRLSSATSSLSVHSSSTTGGGPMTSDRSGGDPLVISTASLPALPTLTVEKKKGISFLKNPFKKNKK